MIKTKSIYDDREFSDGTRILITRYWPRGIRREHFDTWCKDLSPSKELLRSYKNGKIGIPLFLKYFQKELTMNEKAMELCKQIAAKSIEIKCITLLCYERDESSCHRGCVKNICEKFYAK